MFNSLQSIPLKNWVEYGIHAKCVPTTVRVYAKSGNVPSLIIRSKVKWVQNENINHKTAT